MESALKQVPGGDEAEFFPSPGSMYGTALPVVWRDGKLRLDNGNCRESATLEFFSGSAPRARANCKPNEVEVPSVIGKPLALAKARLEQQPLTPNIVYKPAKPRQRLDIVLAQYPSHGRLSSYDTVTLVLPKALYGAVPNVLGLDLRHARQRLRRVQLSGVVIRFADGPPGRVVSQSPSAGVAGTPHMKVSLVVGTNG
jgi:hypothetical protein